MLLEKTLNNLRRTKESFFNCKKDDFISIDLYKHNLRVYYQNSLNNNFILTICKDFKMFYDIKNKFFYSDIQDKYGYYHYILLYKFHINEKYYLRLLK